MPINVTQRNERATAHKPQASGPVKETPIKVDDAPRNVKLPPEQGLKPDFQK